MEELRASARRTRERRNRLNQTAFRKVKTRASHLERGWQNLGEDGQSIRAGKNEKKKTAAREAVGTCLETGGKSL